MGMYTKLYSQAPSGCREKHTLGMRAEAALLVQIGSGGGWPRVVRGRWILDMLRDRADWVRLSKLTKEWS